MCQKKRNKDRRNPNWDEPFIANVTRRMKREPMRRQLGVKLLDQRFERCSLKTQAKCGDPAFEEFLVAQRCPIDNFHFRDGTALARRCHAFALEISGLRKPSVDEDVTRLTSRPTRL